MVDPSDILTTRGITSEIRDGEVVVGHTCLMDYDGTVPFSRVLSDNMDLPGPTFIFESSPDSYHVWNCLSRSVEDTILCMAFRKCDPMHLSVGARRGRWTLRVREKDRINSADSDTATGPYRQAPEPVEWWVNPTEREISLPHVYFAGARFGWGDETPDRITDRCPNRVGDSYRYEQYLTLSDRIKNQDG